MRQEWEPGTEVRLLVGGGVALLALLSGLLVYFVAIRDTPPPPAAAPDPSPEPAATTAREVALRSGPGANVAILTTLAAGTPLEIIGRAPGGEWILAHAAGQPGTAGWIPVDAVEGLTAPGSIPIVRDYDGVQPEATARPGAQPTFTPDLPDLVLEDAFSRANRLVVVIANRGVADVTQPLIVTVNGHAPHPVDVKPGEPLRPGDRIEWEVTGEYVQRRALVSISVGTEVPIEEERRDNNALEVIITPDEPNDLELLGAQSGPGEPLTLILVNNSPIPVRGNLVIAVREAPPRSDLIGRETVSIEIDAGGEERIVLDSIREVDLTEAQVRFSTDAIGDADQRNNAYPR